MTGRRRYTQARTFAPHLIARYKEDCPVRIYAVTNLINGKQYVGMTTMSVPYRWGKHKTAALKPYRKTSMTPFHRDIQRFGVEHFAVELLYEAVSVLEGAAVERAVIVSRRSYLPEYGYNCTMGGDRVLSTQYPQHELERLRKHQNVVILASSRMREYFRRGKKVA